MNKTKEYKKLAVFLIFMILLKVSFGLLADKYGSVSFQDLFTSVLNVKNIVAITNDSRKAAGLVELKVNPKLQAAAQKKAEDMLKKQYFAHSGPSGRMAWDFMDDAGYNYLFAGENLAMNFDSAEAVNRGWLESITHKENILSDKYSQIGVGVTAGRFMGADSKIVVQMFGKPLQSGVFKKLEKAARQKRPERLVARASDVPVVKGAAIERYMADLVENNEANWRPSASGISLKSLLDMIFVSVLVSGAVIFSWRCRKRCR